MEKLRKYQRMLTRLGVFAAILLIFILCFMSLFGLFETISIRAMLRMNTEFSAQVSSISDSMQSLIHTIGTQVFYISPTAKLRQSTSMTRNEQVFALRELWQYVVASQMLHSIYIYNDRLNHVYTTDNDHISAPPDEFYDQGAIRLFESRNAGNRMQLIYRTYDNEDDYPKPLELISYLVFEVDRNGQVGGSAVMLNLFPGWFSENLLNFSRDRYIILSPDGNIVATQDEALTQPSLALLPRVLGKRSGYFIDEMFGEKTICFHSPIGVNDWYCLRFMSYRDCLPGLLTLRNTALLFVGALFTVLFIMLLYALLRIYFPYRLLSSALKNADGDNGERQKLPAFAQLNEMVAASREQTGKDALRRWLEGHIAVNDAPPDMPCTLFLIERMPIEEPLDILRREAPKAVTVPLDGDTVMLCGMGGALEAAELCNRLAALLECRCYYSRRIADISELPLRCAALKELQALRFFSPGQRVFSETLLSARTLGADSLESDISACLAAIKTGSRRAAADALARLIDRLRQCRYTDVLFVMQSVDYQLDAMLPHDQRPSGRSGLINALASAQDTASVLSYFAPKLDRLYEGLSEQKKTREREVAEQVLYRLEHGFRDSALNAQMIAEEMGLSCAYIRRQFYGVYGMSIGDCLNKIRIDEARRMLRETALPVERIAQSIGFENTKYMFVLFKKQTGVTPRQYRLAGEGEDTSQ